MEAAAHSAVLISVPYFEAKLREEWSGTTAWNLHNKLRLRLPCPAGAETLTLFLQGMYGDLRSLFEVKPESLLLQVRLLRVSHISALTVSSECCRSEETSDWPFFVHCTNRSMHSTDLSFCSWCLASALKSMMGG